MPSVEFLEKEEENNREAKRVFVENVGLGEIERLVGHRRLLAQWESSRRAFLLLPMAVLFGPSSRLGFYC